MRQRGFLMSERSRRWRQKTAGLTPAVFGKEPGPKLLQLHFLVFDVLACLGIKFHDQHLFGHRLLVLGRGVEVTGTRSGFQLDLVASAFASPWCFSCFGHVRAGLRARSRCRSCRSGAGQRWKRAGAPSGSRSRPRNGGIAGLAGTGAWFCCWRGNIVPDHGLLPVTSQTRAMRTPDTYNGCLQGPVVVKTAACLQPHLARKGGGNPIAGGFMARAAHCKYAALLAKPWIIARFADQLPWSRKRWASRAAMQPVPALVMAWR